MTTDSPRVSVITVVHNGERFLAEAIDSILGQTFGSFEYLLVDDVSSDASPAIVARCAAADPRIVPLRTTAAPSQSGAINTALKMAQGEYVAILDADDRACPERLARQMRFLDTHPTVGVVGAQAQQIDEEGRPGRTLPFPTSHTLSRWTIFFATPVLHSAAMLRRRLLQEVGGYSLQWRYANDFSLWAELIERTEITNLPETLVAYRRHAAQMSSISSKLQRGEVWLLICRMLASRLALRVPLNEIGLLYHGVRGLPLANAASLQQAADLLAAMRSRYLALEQPSADAAAQIDVNCGQQLLTMAWVHRHSQRSASRDLLQRALQYDPQLWRRPQTAALLHRLHQQDRTAAA